MKWANRILAAFVILGFAIVLRGMRPPREVRRMLAQLSPPAAKDIGELCYGEGYSTGSEWYRSLEKRYGDKQMMEALSALAAVPNKQIADCAITILAEKHAGSAPTEPKKPRVQR